MPSRPPDTIYRLKVTLRDIRPPIWRRVEVPGHVSLHALHEILNEAMGWTDSHLHDFEIGGVEYTVPDDDMDPDRPAEDDRRWRLDAVVTGVGTPFLYRYDFGDDWRHDVLVEAIDPPDPAVAYPRVTAGRRRCPPEDCGGPWGYAELLAVLADPGDPEHASTLESIGGTIDPEAFSIEDTNQVLLERFADLKPLRRSSRRPSPPGSASAAAIERAVEPTTVVVRADGTVRLPASVVHAMDLTGGGVAILVAVGKGVMLMRDPRTRS
jgi:hypothetical protein